jgi:hypothetical protein
MDFAVRIGIEVTDEADPAPDGFVSYLDETIPVRLQLSSAVGRL